MESTKHEELNHESESFHDPHNPEMAQLDQNEIDQNVELKKWNEVAESGFEEGEAEESELN